MLENHTTLAGHDMNLLGTHNYENVCAAIAMTKAAGIPDDIIVQQVKKFKAVEHRIEYIVLKSVFITGLGYFISSLAYKNKLL